MRFCFRDCELNTDRCELLRAGQPIVLRAKAFQLLTYLIEQRHRRVSKDELLERLWPDRVITEATLNSCVKTVRQAVGDNGQQQQIIQTLRGLGYRFVGELQLPTNPSCDVELHQQSPNPSLAVAHTQTPAPTEQDAYLPLQ